MALFDRYTKIDIVEKNYNCQSGQVWKLGKQFLIYDIIKSKMFKACITSPPYNANTKELYNNSFNDNKKDYNDWLLKVISIIDRLVKGYFNLNISYTSNSIDNYIDIVYYTKAETDFNLIDTAIWNKNRGYYGNSKKYLFRRFEFIFIFNNDIHKEYKKISTNVLNIFNHSQVIKGFNASFPMELPKFFLELETDKNDLILETFAGTGTVLIASQQLNRISYNIEINPNFANMILNRFYNEFAIEPILIN